MVARMMMMVFMKKGKERHDRSDKNLRNEDERYASPTRIKETRHEKLYT